MSNIIIKNYLVGINGSVSLETLDFPYISNSINRYKVNFNFEGIRPGAGEELVWAIAFRNTKGIFTYKANFNDGFNCIVPKGILENKGMFQVGLIALSGEYSTEEDDNGTLIKIPTGKIDYKYSTLWSLPQNILEGTSEGDLDDYHDAKTILEEYVTVIDSLENRVEDLENTVKQIQIDVDSLKNDTVTSWEMVQQIVRNGLADKIFKIGDQFVCNHTYFGELIWDVIGFNHDIPADSEYRYSLTLQLHDCLSGPNKEFDEAEPTNPNNNTDYSLNVRSYGSNDWTTSNARQWLNSDGKAGNWFSPQTDYDVAPNNYRDLAGFLNGLDEDFLNVLGAVVKKTKKIENENLDTSIQMTEDMMFLLSRTEVCEDVLDEEEGAPYQYYSEQMSLEGTNCRTKYKNGYLKFHFLRSPDPTSLTKTYMIHQNGVLLGSYCAAKARDFAPACCII